MDGSEISVMETHAVFGRDYEFGEVGGFDFQSREIREKRKRFGGG